MTIQGPMFAWRPFAGTKRKQTIKQSAAMEVPNFTQEKTQPRVSPQMWQTMRNVRPVRFGVKEEIKKQVRLFQPLPSVAMVPAEGLLDSEKALESFTTDPVIQPLRYPKLFTHQGFDHEGSITYDHYALLDPGVSKKLLLNEQNATPEHLKQLWSNYFKPWQLFNPPLYNPDAVEQTNWINWLPKPYSEIELAGLKRPPEAGLPTSPITSVPSQGGDQDKNYWYWWLRDSEAVAFPYAAQPQAKSGEQPTGHWLGANITYTNLHRFLSRKRDSAKQFILSDAVRNRVRQNDLFSGINQPKDGYFLIKAHPKSGEFNENWAHVQLDALGMHLAALASHLKEARGEEAPCIRWKDLTPEDKETMAVLYGFIARYDYANQKDAGPWEHGHDQLRSSSVGMVTNGLMALQELLFEHPDGNEIRQYMNHYFNGLFSNLTHEEREKRTAEVLLPLENKETFESTLVVPGFKRLYQQLPFEDGTGMAWDSATLMLPFYAPKVLERMEEMREKYFKDVQVDKKIQAAREAFDSPGLDAASLTKQILLGHKLNLWRQSGIARYAWDEYERLPGSNGGAKGSKDPEWTLFAPMHAALWFKSYQKTMDVNDFLQGLDAWNLAMSSLTRYRDVRSPNATDYKVKWMESVIPQSDPKKTILPNRVRDLAWTHAAAASMWEAAQPAVELYDKLHRLTYAEVV